MDNDGYQGAKKKRPLYTHARNAPRICARFSSRKSPDAESGSEPPPAPIESVRDMESVSASR